MKILMVSSFYYPIESGVEVFAREIAERLVRDGHTVHLITGKWGKLKKLEVHNGVYIHRVPCVLKRYLSLPSLYIGMSASNLFQKLDYDIVHAHSVFPPGLVARLNKKKSAPLIVTVQGGDVGIYKDSGIGKFFKLLKPSIRGTLKRAKVTAISFYLAERCKLLGAKDVTIIRNGCDTKTFVPLEKEGRVILTVSRLVPKNGVDTLIKAFNNIQDKGAELVIVGEGHQRADLEILAKFNPRIRFLGHVSHDKIPEMMGKARIFARTSTDEGLGIVFAEAMACKTPVIATNVGGIPELIENEVTGLLVPPNNVKETTKAIDKLLGSPHTAMVERAYEQVQDEFSWDSIYEKTLTLYNEELTRKWKK